MAEPSPAAADPPSTTPLRYGRPIQARAHVRGVLLLQALANGAGAVAVMVYLRILFPDAANDETDFNTAVFAAYLIVTLVVALPINRRFLLKGLRWVRDGREPTDLERWNTITQPMQQTVSAFLVWVGGALIFGALHASDPLGLRIAIGISVAGLITCSLLYYLLERHFRPIFALALHGAALPRWRREILSRLMLAWLLGSALPLLAVGLAPITGDPEQLARSGLRLTVLVFSGVIAGGLVLRAAAGAVSQPIEEVTDALARIEEGDLDVEVPVTNIGELGRLQAGVNNMVVGLRDRQRLKELFGRQVGSDVARRAMDHDPELGGEEREVTALFVDLEDFTQFTEQHSAEEVVAELNAFFASVIHVVMREGGWVNKFEGDAALCIFGAPDALEDHAGRALAAARALPAELARLPGAPSVGIGVATGRVVAGHVGTAERYEYTVIGDAVNVAARLTELAKREYGGVLASEETIAAARNGNGPGKADAACWQPCGRVAVRGRKQPTGIFEPIPLGEAAHPATPPRQK